MRLALSKPSTILIVASAGPARADLVSAAAACDGADVAVAESVAAGREGLDGDDVACLVVGDVHGDVVGFASAVESDVPILYCPSNADDDAVADVATAGARYVPRVDGVRTRLVGVIRDAVERYRDRWTRAEESEILDTMLSDLDVALYAKDEQGRHVKVSDVKGGPVPEEQYGNTDPEVFADDHPFNSDETYRDDVRVIETGEPIREKVQRHGEGRATIWLRSTKVPWRGDDGTVKGLVGISENITELKERVETLERRVERLENFVSYASHDLTNPLQVATGHLELARQQDDDEAALEKIETSLERMEEMLDDFRQTSQSGAFPDDGAGMVSLVRVVEDVWETIDSGAATLDVSVPDDAAIGAAESELRPLFENLLKNAVEHGSTSPRSSPTREDAGRASSSEPSVADAPEDAVEHGSTSPPSSSTREDAVVHGGEDVTVTVGPLASGFYVADDGPGIPADERDAVTEQGYTTAESGSGSGLAIVTEVATDNEWDFAVAESESGGARFEFRNVMLVADRSRTTVADATLELDEAVDVGTVTAGDRATYDANADRWTIECDGTNIWRRDNDFHFVFTRVSGDVRIEGRVRDVEPVNQFSKAGFMLRDGTDEDSAYGHVGATATRGSEVLWRERHGTMGRSQLFGDEDDRFEHYRIERVGDTVTCSVSGTGRNWRAVDQRPVDFDDPILVGIAVCSLSPRYPTTATVEDVTVASLFSSRGD